MSARVEFSFGIYCWVHLPSLVTRVQDPGTRRATEFPLPSPCSCLWFYSPSRVLLLNAHLGTFNKQSQRPQGVLLSDFGLIFFHYLAE